MEKILKICSCPNCGKPVDITEWDGVDPQFCVCGEQFEWEEFDKTTIKEI